MKSIDELKGLRKRKKKRRNTDTAASTQTHRRTQSRVGVPTMPRKGHDDSYTLDSLYDTFNL